MAEAIEQKTLLAARLLDETEFLYPLRLAPIYKDYLWGGGRIRQFFARPLPADKLVAESWEIADHPNGKTAIANGPLRGVCLSELVQRRPTHLFGDDEYARFPLIMKHLDALQTLSVQVHPDRQTAAELGFACQEKTEAWVVVDATEGSSIWAGFQEGVEKRDVEAAVRNGTLAKLLHKITPKVGDCLLLEAGTVHALGAGVMVAEVQQSSDLTFRLFDWNRVGNDGKPRELHIQEGLQSLHLHRGPVKLQQAEATASPQCERLVTCPEFLVNRWSLELPQVLHGDGIFRILTLLDGAVDLIYDGEPTHLRRGDTILLPASLEQVTLTALNNQPATLIEAHMP